ncbi:MAG: CapA family protein, partial [Bacteroidota bacterium]
TKPTEELLTLLNVSCVSLANNHIYDCKMSGLKATIGILDKLGIKHTGAGWKKDHTDPVIVETKDAKIGFIAYVDKSTNPKTEYFPELFINYFEPEKVIEDVKGLKPKVDRIICSIHWGVDYSHYPIEEQRVIARKLVDAGVNIIMGHHPHTLQPFEIYKGNYIFYSLGSLTFGDYIKEGKNELQALFRKTKHGLITKYDTQANKVEFVSTHEKKGNFISIINRDYNRWSSKKWKCYNLKQNYKMVNRLIVFKEKVLDRVFEYFFGYYKNPVKRLFQLSNLKKIKKLLK